jgi:complex iron-sulfur molybdoenzyme family reductase subunit gamma
MEQILCDRTTKSEKELLDSGSAFWKKSRKTKVETTATPLANQPSPYIKGVYDESKIGAVKELSLSVVHNNKNIFFYFEWASPKPNREIGDINVFPDGLGVLFPLKDLEKTQIKEMGSKEYPTNGWYWRPDFDEKPKNQVAHGLSTTLYTKKSSIQSHSSWSKNTWCLVMTRPLTIDATDEEAVQLKPGSPIGIGFAVWEGSNGERGGVKAFSKEWRELVIS